MNEKQINKKKSINFQKSLSVIQYTLTVMKLLDKCCYNECFKQHTAIISLVLKINVINNKQNQIF